MNLELLGITETEARVLKATIQTQPCTATELMRSTGLHRKVIYDAINRLHSNGYIVSQKQGKERRIAFAGTTAIEAHIEEMRAELNQKEIALKELSQEIERTKSAEPIDAYTATGTSAVRSALKLLHEEKADYDIIGAPLTSSEIMGDAYWMNYHERRKELDLHVRMLWNPSLKEWADNIRGPHVDIRFFSLIEPLSETLICKDLTITIIWTQEPRVHVVRSQAYADSQKHYFELLWAEARP